MPISVNPLHSVLPPSPWVLAHLDALPARGRVLDLACGSGRHVRLLSGQNHPVLAVDRDEDAVFPLRALPAVEVQVTDLEGDDWPLAGQQFDGIVVTNYLWRSRLPDVLALLAPGGVLIYETFMLGNAAYGKPSNPEFLLRPGELREVCRSAGLHELDFVEGYVDTPKPAMRQAICAQRPARESE